MSYTMKKMIAAALVALPLFGQPVMAQQAPTLQLQAAGQMLQEAQQREFTLRVQLADAQHRASDAEHALAAKSPAGNSTADKPAEGKPSQPDAPSEPPTQP